MAESQSEESEQSERPAPPRRQEPEPSAPGADVWAVPAQRRSASRDLVRAALVLTLLAALAIVTWWQISDREGVLERLPVVEFDPAFIEQVERLSSDDANVRRAARSTLAGQGVKLVPAAMERLSSEDIAYHERLGLIVALTEMMRVNKNRRGEIAAMLSEGDLRALLDAATDPERTLRVYAAEFLFDLGEPRSFDLAVQQWERTENDEARYNLALIMKGAAPAVSLDRAPEVRSTIASLKGPVGEKTDRLLDEAADLLPR